MTVSTSPRRRSRSAGSRISSSGALPASPFSAAQHGLDGADRAALAARPEVRELFDREVRRVNEGLAHYEQIVSWTVLPEDFSVESGELTPTQKVKRRVIDQKYAEEIESLYREPPPERGERAAGGRG